jgi:hypothetical protein
MRLIDIVLKNPNFWNFYRLSSNPNITLQDIENNPNLPWKFDMVSSNPNITLDFVKRHLDKEWDWDMLSQFIPINDIMSTGNDPNYKWSWNGMSSNPTLTEDFLVRNLNHDWNLSVIVATMPLEFIETHNDFLRAQVEEFDFMLSFNPNVTLEYTQTFDCDWVNFSENGKFTFQEVLDNLNLPWSWRYLSKRIDINNIIKHKELQWDWEHISKMNSSVTMQVVNDNPTLSWDKVGLQSNPGITIKDIEKYFDKNYIAISENSNLTIDFYLRHKNRFTDETFYFLSENLWNLKMTKAKKELLETTMALSGLRILPPYVIEHITSYSITTPSIDLFDKIKIIESVLKKRPIN